MSCLNRWGDIGLDHVRMEFAVSFFWLVGKLVCVSSRHLFPVVIVQVLLVFWPGSFSWAFIPCAVVSALSWRCCRST